MKFSKLTIFIFILLITFTNTLYAAQTNICEGQYALCAYAKCIPVPGEKGKAMCTCEVKSGYSVGSNACQTKSKVTPEGFQTLISRYYPINKYVNCHNKRAWADCYNSQCVVNPDNDKQAFCTCSISKNKGDYINASDSCDATSCESGMISSFLIKESAHDNSSISKLPNYDKIPHNSPESCPAK